MGLMTTVLLGAMAASSAISSGNAKKHEADYNATVSDQQVGMIEAQKGLEGYQYDRAIGRMGSTLMAKTAKSGLNFSGSPLAVLLDTQTQMELDKSIGQYNYDVQKFSVQQEAAAYRRQGKYAQMEGYTNAFTSLLSMGSNYGMSNLSYQKPKPQNQATRAGKL